MAAGLTLVAGGGLSVRVDNAPAKVGGQTHVSAQWLCRHGRLASQERWTLPEPQQPTLSEVFAQSARDGGWAGFLLPQLETAKPLLWIQDRMAIRESGRVHPAGLPGIDLIHVEARDGKDALWAMEEGLRCLGLGAVIGELYGDPASLDFTATRRLAVAAERTNVPCWLIRLGGAANLSGARMRWRIASRPSLPHAFDFKASGAPAWDAELFRARSHPPGRWSIAHEADRFHLLAVPGDRALAEGKQRHA